MVQARVTVVAWLKEKGLFKGITDNPEMTLARCTRTDDIIEPMLKPQWFVRMKGMAAKAVAAVKDKVKDMDLQEKAELTIIPSKFEADWSRCVPLPLECHSDYFHGRIVKTVPCFVI